MVPSDLPAYVVGDERTSAAVEHTLPRSPAVGGIGGGSSKLVAPIGGWGAIRKFTATAWVQYEAHQETPIGGPCPAGQMTETPDRRLRRTEQIPPRTGGRWPARLLE
jgi:hypothetical protein